MEFVASPEELRAHYKQAAGISVRKEMKRLDPHARGFLAKSPFVLIGSADNDGNSDVTPKGDKPGFAAVLDDRTVAIPDRPGNNRLDTWENIVVNPAVGLIFLIPGMDETLRINGQGRITFDQGLRDQLAVDSRPAVSVLVVTVQTAYMHCAKAFMRSGLWQPDTWPERASMPTLGQILKDQIAMSEAAEEIDRSIDGDYRNSMW